MDLDDEVSSVCGLIEQPSLQITDEGEQDQDQAPLSPSKAKKRRMDETGNTIKHFSSLKSV